MNGELSLMHLVGEASLLVQLVMLILLTASVGSWMLIFQHWQLFRRVRTESETFEGRFWSGRELSEIHREVRDGESRGQAAIFEAGYNEFSRLPRGAPVLDTVQRAMRVVLNREVDALEHRLGWLATIGSVSPYVGLFGTVWGIMNSFTALGDVQQATLARVAPGIAEALFATAMGLFAAIPAVIAYNRFSQQAERLAERYDNFIEEFGTLLLRHAGR